MATRKTETTELSLAAGILGLDLRTAGEEELARRFEGTLPAEVLARVRRSLDEDAELRATAGTLQGIGRRLQEARPDLLPPGANVRWLGPLRQASTVTSSQDLACGTTTVSVKAGSRVVFNLSPYNLFVSVPGGLVRATGTGNWFLEAAPVEYQHLFGRVSDVTGFRLVSEFEASRDKAQRERVQGLVAAFQGEARERFDEAYRALCQAVAEVSATRFNETLASTRATPHAPALEQSLLGYFLRLGDAPHLLVSLRGATPEAFLVPGVTEWSRRWRLASLEAAPDREAGQSKVDLGLVLAGPRGKEAEPRELRFHAEVRWSHGKFCGNPEAKLYRDFEWEEVPDFERIV